MQSDSLDWDDLRIALAVAEAGSLSAAARSLGLSHSTVLRRLGAFEAKIGVRLFDRQPRGYAPTAAGLETREAAARMAAEVAGLSRRLAGQDLRLEGSVRLTAPDDVMETLLIDRLARFRRDYPGIRVEAVIDNRMLSLTRREADIAVRPTRSPDDALVGRRVASVATAVYGNPARVTFPAPARAPDTLAGCPWIGWEQGGAPASLGAWLRRAVPEPQVVYRTNSMLNQLTACWAGLGLALLPCFLGDTSPELVRILGPLDDLETGLWLLTHEDLRRTARVRALLDFLFEELKSQRPLLQGERPRKA